jgi:2-polyprenyl-6-methoxyphenol hydroxylase-like FAD-dependent oxidoreductase
MTTSSPSGAPYWESDSRVTVLGDAVHCMPPTGGQGANTALHDAALLGLMLGQASGAGDDWSKEVVGRYEDGMRKNVGDVVGLACIAAKGIMGATIPP